MESCGNLKNKVITENHSAFSLAGMVNPTFQNKGTSTVNLDGRLIAPGETYSVYLNLVLQNAIPITFEKDKSKTRILYIGYGEII
ncbi:hypothetical protein DNC80_07710 [Flavobacterium sp. SOK18b]|uniref:hypothetical protein n=1 Tax=Flavobacterium sp. SOK18b TaxID=797900 RepID=UPI0015FBC027|nr:hypothetical protein [Flavobacterium sp. SOK18b]MBB1193554.1 hypothetical protein [Flavobacterium sp. SOK18b]